MISVQQDAVIGFGNVCGSLHGAAGEADLVVTIRPTFTIWVELGTDPSSKCRDDNTLRPRADAAELRVYRCVCLIMPYLFRLGSSIDPL